MLIIAVHTMLRQQGGAGKRAFQTACKKAVLTAIQEVAFFL